MIAIGIAVGMAFAGGLFLGFLIASLMSASFEADAQLEGMRRRHIDDVTAWLEGLR